MNSTRKLNFVNKIQQTQVETPLNNNINRRDNNVDSTKQFQEIKGKIFIQIDLILNSHKTLEEANNELLIDTLDHVERIVASYAENTIIRSLNYWIRELKN
jgi:hypothetical protein